MPLRAAQHCDQAPRVGTERLEERGIRILHRYDGFARLGPNCFGDVDGLGAGIAGMREPLH